MKTLLLSLFCFALTSPAPASAANEHVVGWSNALIPGSGQLWMGNFWPGVTQATYETSAFYIGYRFSDGNLFSLDGFVSPNPGPRNRRVGEISTEHRLYGDLLQELGIKAHMVNTYDIYRAAAMRNGEYPSDMDPTPTQDLFLEPFQDKNLTDPWVYIPMGVVLAATVADYISATSGTVQATDRLTPASNSLYAFNYGVWQPFGSGAPEEMFYRGFLQREFTTITSSSLMALAMTTTLFAFSHEPGSGRNSAAVAGAYLGYLAQRNNGRLGPGITLHFWSCVILGIETVLLNSKGQRNTPPASMAIQINI